MPDEPLLADRPPDVRRHDLDALRAFAMLLGIVLHAALSFMDIPWPVRDTVRAPAFGLAVSAVHGFRMPLFFLLSGFFTAMLCRRRGLGGLLRQRSVRIALPLALGCATIVPLMWVVVIWAGATGSSASDDPVDTGSDIWTAAAYGNLDAVRAYAEGGAALDGAEPIYGQSPLAWAVIGDNVEVVAYLLDAGADPSARYRDRNTALHAAAFFGRAEAAGLIIEAGADLNAVNVQGETPLDSMRHGKGTTEFIAGLLNTSIEFDAVTDGRDRIRPMLEERGAVSGSEALATGDAAGERRREIAARVMQGLMLFPFFHHLWFLWFLCWLVVGFAIVVAVGRMLPRVPVPSIAVTSPWCLAWLVPLTMLLQSMMNQGSTVPGFGADTSAGLVPMPHVLGYYAVFFGFGALLYGRAGAGERLGRGWWIQLPLALLLLPVALAFALQFPWALETVEDAATRRLLSSLAQVVYTWLMIFGLMGLFEAILARERAWVRYASDSSYWLYLVHLPLIIVGQMLLREASIPALVKVALLTVVTTSILLVSYQLLVRYTWIGRLLNGRRTRARGPRSGAQGLSARDPRG